MDDETSKRTKKRAIAIALLLILVMLISVGYAVLSTNLTIKGNTTVKGTNWLIYFDNVQPTQGSITPTTAPTTEGKTTTTLTWAVGFDTPGQFYEFTVDAVNEGTVDAMINTATEEIVTSTLDANQRKYLDYTVTYSDGAPVEQYDKLAAGTTETLRVRVKYKDDVSSEDLPQTDQEVSFTYTSDYVQVDDNAKDREVANNQSTPINFYITGKVDYEYQCLSGMTWQEFVASDYNVDPRTFEDDTQTYYFTIDNGYVLHSGWIVKKNDVAVSPNDIIEATTYTEN